MKDTIKFSWEGSAEHKAGVAVYKTSRSSYLLRLPNFKSANLVYMALRDAYAEGYEEGVRHMKAALLKLLE
jgi:hypothetical protein